MPIYIYILYIHISLFIKSTRVEYTFKECNAKYLNYTWHTTRSTYLTALWYLPANETRINVYIQAYKLLVEISVNLNSRLIAKV